MPFTDDDYYPTSIHLKSDAASHTIENENMVNVPNWLPLTFLIEDGARFDLKRRPRGVR
jgi:trehalose/maltose hydrolase-like predicted phosphorylase